MPIRPAVQSKGPRTRWVLVALLLFASFIFSLTAITYHIITEMVSTATRIDDARAARAAEIALVSMKAKMGDTLTDNAAWDEAFEALAAPDPRPWIYKTWGRLTVDYVLYDGMAIFNHDGSPLAAFLKDKPFSPTSYFGPELAKLQARAHDNPQSPVVSFLQTGDGPAVVGMEAIEPSTMDGDPGTLKLLLFVKWLNKAALADISQQHGLRDLALGAPHSGHGLVVPVFSADGDRVAELSWQSEEQGAKLYARVRPFLYAGLALLVAFLLVAVYFARLEAIRLRGSATMSWFLATHDQLSGLLNRSGFFHAIDNDHAGEHVLLLMDLDGFKAVNDTWGHPVGDKLIQRVAEALAGCHPDVDHVARFGGDEFAIVSSQPDSAGAIINAVLDIFTVPFTIDGHTVEVGVSIGHALSGEGISSSELLRRADLALYHAKDSGKKRAVGYTLELDEAKVREARLEVELRNAMRVGEVHPYFQPLYDAATREIIGVEALARWTGRQDPVPPDVFIALAEKCGLIDTLGATLLEESLKQAGKWVRLRLSVNVSPLQLCNPGFALQVEALLKKTGFDPRRLTLEVTESVLIANPDQARRTIAALKQIGVSFALDDFGSGYASIGVLRQFGFDRIKIDRSLVKAAEVDESGLGVVRATVALATAMNVPVTAEGIENAAQADMLRDAGCDQLQGFLFSRPVTAAAIDMGQSLDTVKRSLKAFG